MTKIKCIHCGKVSYTSSPDLVKECPYCGDEFWQDKPWDGRIGREVLFSAWAVIACLLGCALIILIKRIIMLLY